MAEGTVVQIALAEIQLLRRTERSMPASLAGGHAADRLHSNSPEYVFHAGRPSRLVVGSDACATWRFALPDVAPRQLDIVWDGSELWLQDALRLGRTFVNGRTLNEWVPVVGKALVCFGNVQLMSVSRAKRSTLNAPDFVALDRALLTDAHQDARLRLSDTSRITLPPEVRMLLNERGAR